MNDTIKQIYSCIEDSGNWRQVLSVLASELNSSQATIALRTSSCAMPCILFEHGFDDPNFNKYPQNYHKENLWKQELAQNSSCGFHASHHILDDTLFYEFESDRNLTSSSVRHSITCVTNLSSNGSALEIVFTSNRYNTHYSEQQIRNANIYAPHIVHAISMAQRMHLTTQQTEFATTSLESLSSAVILCNVKGNILYGNKAAYDLFEHTSMFTKGVNQPIGSQHQLMRKIHAVVTTQKPEYSSFYINNQKARYRIALRHWDYKAINTLGSYTESPTVMLFIDPWKTRADVTKEDIQTLFSLTGTEAEICKHLCMGTSPQQLASLRNVSQNTINKQIKMILAKTDSRNQVELVSTVLRTLLT